MVHNESTLAGPAENWEQLALEFLQEYSLPLDPLDPNSPPAKPVEAAVAAPIGEFVLDLDDPDDESFTFGGGMSGTDLYKGHRGLRPSTDFHVMPIDPERAAQLHAGVHEPAELPPMRHLLNQILKEELWPADPQEQESTGVAEADARASKANNEPQPLADATGAVSELLQNGLRYCKGGNEGVRLARTGRGNVVVETWGVPLPYAEEKGKALHRREGGGLGLFLVNDASLNGGRADVPPTFGYYNDIRPDEAGEPHTVQVSWAAFGNNPTPPPAAEGLSNAA